MTKKVLAMLAFALTTLNANAQAKEWFQNVKFSGYGMLQFQAQDKKESESNSFNLRLARMALEGRAHQDFYWKVQMQINGTTKEDASAIRLVDLFGEWQKYEFFKVKVGQFKRPFTFENPMHPITQGFMSYSQPISKLAGFSDRTGEQASNGRDIGLQIQGDFLKLDGRNLLHYQIGVFNGQGINLKDGDKKKDFIGGLWVMPIEGLRIGAFGWLGSRNDVVKRRYAISGEYSKDDWTFRSEYVHSYGEGKQVLAGNKADGFYALGIAPIIKNKLHVKARYDMYRDEAGGDVHKTLYEIGADYLFTKNLQINLEYARVNEHERNYTTMAITKNNYNMVDLELDIRF